MSSLERKICDAIQIISSKTSGDAAAGATTLATIVDCINPAIGKYRVNLRGIEQEAFASNLDIIYTPGTIVYIYEDNVALSKNKIILTADEQQSTKNLLSKPKEIDNYKKISKNLVKKFDFFNVADMVDIEEKVLFDTENIKYCLNNADAIVLRMGIKIDFETKKEQYQPLGIKLTLSYKDDNGEDKDLVLSLSTTDFSLVNFTPIEKIFNIPKGHSFYVKKIEALGFNENILFQINNFSMFALQKQSIEEYLYGGLAIIPNYSLDNVELTATINIKGVPIKPIELKKIKFYWFKEDGAEDYKTDNWCSLGGDGWSCLNAFDNSSGFKIWASAGNKINIPIKELNFYQNNYKCIAVFDNDVLEHHFNLYQNNKTKLFLRVFKEADSLFAEVYSSETISFTQWFINGEKQEEFSNLLQIPNNLEDQITIKAIVYFSSNSISLTKNINSSNSISLTKNIKQSDYDKKIFAGIYGTKLGEENSLTQIDGNDLFLNINLEKIFVNTYGEKVLLKNLFIEKAALEWKPINER